ncbi:MAG: hypothetical protein JNM14_08740 [Ferruginibacter sp.]|nr:hypothetical protein [Ferruginibacter sp.]
MNINRHNYEEFFLLYVDNELSATDRKAVDVFVQQHPDLKIELDLLQQTVVSADDIVLQKKDWLYMEEDISALQENLLLYVDGELKSADKKSFERIIATDKTALVELDILLHTKLQPDMAVVFEDKQLLYRKESGRVVPFKWWRAAAAVVLLGIGLWTGISVYKNPAAIKPDGREVVRTVKTQGDQKTNNITPNNKSETQQPGEISATENGALTTATQKINETQSPGNKQPGVEKNNEQNPVSSKKNITVQTSSNKKPDNNLPKPALQNINNNSSNETIVQNVQSSNNNSNRVSGNNEAVVMLTPKDYKIIAENTNSNKTDPDIKAIAVVNNNKAADGENNNSYLDVDDDKQKRSALGGFLRKAKRVLERTANVKTGDGVKIAGFEIALK